MGRLHIHALGINTGGGLILLRQLLQSKSTKLGFLSLDQRIQQEFSDYPNAKFFKHGIKSEYTSQLSLRKSVKVDDHILFFANRPPLIKFPCKVSVFQQNALLLQKINWKDIRGKINQWWLKVFNKNADGYIVQNQVMRRDLRVFLGCLTEVKVAPFTTVECENKSDIFSKTKNFIYVSSFAPHKNHINLIKAWEYLLENNIKTDLTLITSGNNSYELEKKVKVSKAASQITVVSNLSREKVYEFLNQHKALIYPSFKESLGLPLLEAKSCGLAILASELDYVREIISPEQSFDPNSYVSIARSVMRYLGLKQEQMVVLSPDQFMGLLLKSKKEVLQKAS